MSKFINSFVEFYRIMNHKHPFVYHEGKGISNNEILNFLEKIIIDYDYKEIRKDCLNLYNYFMEDGFKQPSWFDFGQIEFASIYNFFVHIKKISNKIGWDSVLEDLGFGNLIPNSYKNRNNSESKEVSS